MSNIAVNLQLYSFTWLQAHIHVTLQTHWQFTGINNFIHHYKCQIEKKEIIYTHNC